MPASESTIALRRYTAQAAQGAAQAVKSRADAGLLSQLDLALEMARFQFRDIEGSYWYLDAHAGQWHRFDGRDWQPAQAPPSAIEGLDGLPVPPQAGGPPALDEVQSLPGEGALQSPPQAMIDAVGIVRQAYEQGELSSDEATSLLLRRYLIDRWGRFWSVGVRSGRWYVYDQELWTLSDGAPDPETLLRLQPAADVCSACGQPTGGADACPYCGTPVSANPVDAAAPPDLVGAGDEAGGQGRG